MKRESTVQAYLIQEINKLPDCKAINIHGSEYMEVGTPDIICSLGGIFCLIEVKADGGVVSDIQNHRMFEWCAAGAVAVLCEGEMDARKLIGLLTGFNLNGGPDALIKALESELGAISQTQIGQERTTPRKYDA